VCFTGDKVGCCTSASTVDIAPWMVPARATLLSDLFWCAGVDVSLSTAGGWRAPKTPLLAVPLNMTSGYSMWQNMDAALKWTQEWAKGKPTLARRL